MRKFFRQYLPHHETVRNHRLLKPFSGWLHHPNLWHLNRRSVAGGVAVGLFCGLIPGPLQMITAVLFAVLLRVNLPLAAVVTTYTNPFTIVPLYFMAYELGCRLLGTSGSMIVAPPPFPALHWDNWVSALWDWMAQLGEPLLVGLPVLAAGLSVAGYVLVRLVWRVAVVRRWRARSQRKV